MIQRKGHGPIDHRKDGVTAGDTLEVSHHDVAIFARQGQFVRVLQPGSYQVPPEFSGPDMEVFFVLTTPLHDQKFGGNLGAGLPVRAAFGKIQWVIRDPERAVMAVGFSDTSGFDRWVASTFLKGLQHAAGKAHLAGQPLDGLEAAAMAAANETLSAQGVEVLAVTEMQMR